jgi:hypothetical protein
MKKYLALLSALFISINLAIIIFGCDGGTSENRSSTTSSGDSVRATASPSTVNSGGSSAISIEITDSSGNIVSKSPTAVFSTSLGTLTDPDTPPDEEAVERGTLSKTASGGTATVLLTSENTGTATVTISVSGASVTVQVIFVE